MKILLPVLIIQIFEIVLNIPAKELPLYGSVEINNYDDIFLKTDLFKIGKKIELIIFLSFAKNSEYSPYVFLYYCFSDQNKNFSCLVENALSFEPHSLDEKPQNITVRFDNILIIMKEQKYKYLLLKVKVDDDYNPLSIKIIHDPNSGIIATPLLEYYQEIDIDDKGCFYYEVDDKELKSQNDEIEIEISFNSKDKYDIKRFIMIIKIKLMKNLLKN